MRPKSAQQHIRSYVRPRFSGKNDRFYEIRLHFPPSLPKISHPNISEL
ncbi:Uncharacterized protein dnm_025400 [Desulfonema magnum]|uniref:Uncharacterized protein n=1 Tax=Desulfonema magnum TaxID=45655 RepID=A0A975GM42_9BACT|nr:Uncharacterized protein dnm_025400 [Desulfonema magnum]